MASRLFALALIAPVLAGCGGDDGPTPVPTPLAGGGVAGPALDGSLDVFAVDALDETPIAGAEVLLGDGADAPVVGTTDETGLARVADAAATGVVSVTVRASGRVPTALVGVTARELTVPLRPVGSVAPPTATARGTIEGWDSLVVPPGGYVAAFIGYTATDDVTAPENALAQDARADGLPTNVCFKDESDPASCEFVLNTRVGLQAHFAVIVEGMSVGDPGFADDPTTPVGFAMLGGVDATADDVLDGEVLSPVESDALVSIDIDTGVPPGVLADVIGVPGVGLAGEGVIVFPAMLGADGFLGPQLEGAFADGVYWAVGSARDASDTQSSWVFARDLDVDPGATSATLAVGDWLTPPAVVLTDGTVSYDPPAGTALHVVRWLDASGALAAQSYVLDARSDVVAPTDSASSAAVRCLAVADFDPMSFSIGDSRANVTRATTSRAP